MTQIDLDDEALGRVRIAAVPGEAVNLAMRVTSVRFRHRAGPLAR